MNYEYELYHHGVKGMKWGVRRYQNKDGTLTPAGKKRISKQYKKLAIKLQQDLERNYQNMVVTAYNKSADVANNGGIDRFNTSQRKKYGDNYANREGYIDDYNAWFDEVYVNNFNKTLNDFYSTSKTYKKGKELVDKYRMTDWDKLARKNEAAVADVRKAAEKAGVTHTSKNTQKTRKDEERAVIKDMMKSYDKSDPDYEEAMELLKEMYDDID